VFAGKKSAQIREILINESAWEEMTCLFAPSLGHVTVQLPDVWWMYLGGPLGLMSIGLMAILVRGLGLLMLGVASTAGQLLGSVLIDVLIPSLGNSVYLVTIIGTLFALVGAIVTTIPEYRTSKTMKKMEV
jgi:transporter family-2 protein